MTEIEYALRDLGLTMEQLEYLTEQGEVLEFQIDRVEKRQSDIHGYGMFAIEDIPAQTLIGLGSVNYKYKTLLGRYTNHSINPNCETVGYFCDANGADQSHGVLCDTPLEYQREMG